MSTMYKDISEKYRDEDRLQEATNTPLTESQKKQDELEPIQFVEEAERTIENYKKRCQQAELELSIVKAVGQNSPEMKQAIAQIKELEISLANALEVNKSHQKLNGKLQERLTEEEQERIELHADNIKLSQQVEDKVDQLRKSGM